MNFTPRAQQGLALARKEADRFNHNYVGTEHLLLGLLREGEGMGPCVLKSFDVQFEHTRDEILRELTPPNGWMQKVFPLETQDNPVQCSKCLQGEAACEWPMINRGKCIPTSRRRRSLP